ncbi:MAG: flagellar hook-associated protein FlgK [Pseudomonadota bacterium]
MTDVFNIGTSALVSLQRAIATTGQNIANVNTEGYSRQRVEFTALPPQLTGAGFVGSGVTIASITRSFDAFLADDVRARTSSAFNAQTAADLSGRIDSILANPETGLGPSLDSFFAAVQDVANNPGSIPERQVLIREGQGLADRFEYLDGRFSQLDRDINVQIADTVRDINDIANNIADLNVQIVSETVRAGGQPPNDLLDKRDVELTRLAERVGISTFEQDDGAINVFLGNGQSIVVGGEASQLETFADPFDSGRTSVGLAGLSTQTDLSSFISGGELGALFNSRSSLIDSGRAQLGVIATGVSTLINEQSRLGLDLNGNLGSDFFTTQTPAVVPNANNAGGGSVTASIVDPAALTGDTYELSFDGTDFTLRNTNTGTTQTIAGPTPTFTVDGVEVTVATDPPAGDSFLIDPVNQAASLFDVQLTDPRTFAAASPLRSGASLNNAGNGELRDLAVADVAGLPLGTDITLTFAADTGGGSPGFLVSGIAGGPIAYDPAVDGAGGLNVTLGGFTFTLSGTPEEGDSFTIENNVDGSGDNRNALALAALQTSPQLFGGTASFQDSYASLIADIAVESRQARSAAETEQALLDQALSARDSIQGVNLDEEAANLIRFQQAYQAAARVVQVADEVFQTLLNATG